MLSNFCLASGLLPIAILSNFRSYTLPKSIKKTWGFSGFINRYTVKGYRRALLL